MKTAKKSITTYLTFLNIILSAGSILSMILFLGWGYDVVEYFAIVLMLNAVYWITFFYLLRKSRQNINAEFDPKVNSLASISLYFLYFIPMILFFGGLSVGKILESAEMRNRAEWEKQNCIVTIDESKETYKCNNGESFVRTKTI